MAKKPPLKIPLDLLALDFVGVLVLALGILEGFTDKNVFPDALKFDHYPYVLIGLGVALMAPLFLHIIRHITRDPNQSSLRDRETEI
jgi:hypothetical protein